MKKENTVEQYFKEKFPDINCEDPIILKRAINEMRLFTVYVAALGVSSNTALYEDAIDLLLKVDEMLGISFG